MRRYSWILGLVAVMGSACNQPVDVAKEREALLAVDREWSGTTKDPDKFMSYFASDASVYPPGMPVQTGTAAIRKVFADMTAPGTSLRWTPTKAGVSASGELGYTAGTYEMTMDGLSDNGKYVTIWKKQSDGAWKVSDDIINTDSAGPPPSQHVIVAASDMTWGDAPPAFPKGAKMAVIAGDPSKAAPYALRVQVPAGYRVPPHWHPTDENITVITGTLALGIGEQFDAASAKDVPAGGYAVLPANMRHFAIARTDVTVQIAGIGPFAITYVNPADDPSKSAQ